jgi:hypothetical protein
MLIQTNTEIKYKNNESNYPLPIGYVEKFNTMMVHIGAGTMGATAPTGKIP